MNSVGFENSVKKTLELNQSFSAITLIYYNIKIYARAGIKTPKKGLKL